MTRKSASAPTTDDVREIRAEIIDLQEEQSQLYDEYMRKWSAIEKKVEALEAKLSPN